MRSDTECRDKVIRCVREYEKNHKNIIHNRILYNSIHTAYVFCLSVHFWWREYYSANGWILATVLIFSLCVKKIIRNNYSKNVDIARITLLVLNFVLIGIMFFVFGLVLNF